MYIDQPHADNELRMTHELDWLEDMELLSSANGQLISTNEEEV